MPAASHSVPSAAVPRARPIDGAWVGDEKNCKNCKASRPEVDLNMSQQQFLQFASFFGGFDVLLNLRRYILMSIR